MRAWLMIPVVWIASGVPIALLIDDETQLARGRPLTPTVSPEYGGEGAVLLPLPLPLAGEG